MKKRLLIVEPSEVIVAGLKALLDGQIRLKVLEPEMSADHLDERMIAARPDVVLINPTLIGSPDLLHHGHEAAVVALVYQYVERDRLKHYDAVIDIRDSRAGKTNKEIADALNVSVHTVISHRKNITHKTGIKSVAGLTVYAMLNNLVDESTLM